MIHKDREIRHRTQVFERGAVDLDARTVQMAVSSETPVARSFGNEILDHSAESVDLDFFGGGAAPLLKDHDPTQQIGVVETVGLDETDRMLRAQVRFSRSALADEILCLPVGWWVTDDDRARVAEQVRAFCETAPAPERPLAIGSSDGICLITGGAGFIGHHVVEHGGGDCGRGPGSPESGPSLPAAVTGNLSG